MWTHPVWFWPKSTHFRSSNILWKCRSVLTQTHPLRLLLFVFTISVGELMKSISRDSDSSLIGSAALMDSSELTSSVKRDITEVQSLCASIVGYGAQSPYGDSVKSQRDLWRRWAIRDFKIRRFTRNKSSELPENFRSTTLHLRIRHWWSEMFH